jgi:cyclopropane fatty-acyl-phospholipid synthase-like methyltransferase
MRSNLMTKDHGLGHDTRTGRPCPAPLRGFDVTRVQPLRMHYAHTLDCWSAALEASREHLTGCADLFREGYIDVCQFTLVKGG